MRKLVISLLTTALLLISFVTSTFAFIVISVETAVEFDFNIEGYDGLLISLDGTNYQQDISSKQLKEHIAGSEEAFDNLLFTGVTLKHDASKKIELDANNKALFVKDSIDGTVHTYADAVANSDYLVFDLWLKAEISDSTRPSFDLKLTDKTGIDAEDYTVKLDNKLSTQTQDYASGDEITVNPANSMRLGLSNNGVFTTYECNASAARAADLGSVAIEGGTGINDPAKNAMYTYYNNLHILTPFTQASESDLEGFSDVKNSYTADVVDTFDYGTDSYNVIKLTAYIWLEGWDADYLATIPTSNISVDLCFEIEKQ